MRAGGPGRGLACRGDLRLAWRLEDALQAHELGAQIVLQKPVRIAAISEAVRRLLLLPNASAGS